MKKMFAFTKKEWTEHLRSGRIFVHFLLFLALGIMNVGIAKLTPFLLKLFSESMEESGMVIVDYTVSAADAWIQFIKNAPMGLIAVHLLECGLFTKEINDGTMILAITKGIKRWEIFLSKSFFLFAVWTFEFLLYFGITYLYCTFYWPSPFGDHLMLSAVLWWLFGLLTLSLAILISCYAKSNVAVLGGVGGSVLLMYLVTFLPSIKKYSPAMLSDGNLMFSQSIPSDYTVSLIITIALILLSLALSLYQWNRRQF